MAERLCKVCKGWHDLSEPWPRACVRVRHDRRSGLATPMVVSDALECTSMVDGKTYTSKRALRRSYRERGYTEVGDQRPAPKQRQMPDRRGIRNSIDRAFARVGISS